MATKKQQGSQAVEKRKTSFWFEKCYTCKKIGSHKKIAGKACS